jgi:hypothetical protein
LQFPLRLLNILGKDPDSRVVGVAAVAVGLLDLQGKGKVEDVEQVQHRPKQGPLPDPVLHVNDVRHLAVPQHALLAAQGMSLNIKDYWKIIAILEDNRWLPKYP